MGLDLLAYAQKHRLRTRNLHDGRPLHPLRVPVGGRGRVEGYVGDEDRMDAIVCHHGYVAEEGQDQIGWYVFGREFAFRWLEPLVGLGATVTQEGDSEAAGTAPAEYLEEIVQALKPYQRHPPRSTSSLTHPAPAPRIDAMIQGGVSGAGSSLTWGLKPSLRRGKEIRHEPDFLSR